MRRSGDFERVRKTANWGEACEDLSVLKKCLLSSARKMMRLVPGLGNGMITGMLRKAICHVNILTWPQGFQDKHPYLVLSSLYPVSFGNLETKETLKSYKIIIPKASEQVRILIYRTWPI